MKVLYDHQIFEHQRIGGVSRYFAEIIKNMPQEVEVDVSVEYSFNEYLKDIDIPFQWKEQLITYYSFFPSVNFKGKKSLFNFIQTKFPQKYPDCFSINKEKAIKKIKDGDFDIFHPTFYDDYYLETIGSKPYVLTVHDMIIELYPEFINSPQFIARKKKLVDHAAHIIAVSENTKQDIVNVFDTHADKISVIYHASSLKQTSDFPSGLPAKYILYVGDRRLGYKNFSFFISSIKPLLIADESLHVVCTGDTFSAQENSFFQQLGIKDKMHIVFAEDNQMYNLYQSAQVFVYPSYYEGFGIPILESFQAGCPLALAKASCFEEVAADAGLYFNPKSPCELRAAIKAILNDDCKRNLLIEKGYERLKNFSWQKSAKQTMEIYRRVLASK